MRKRILASLMALILALSLLPTAALATGETQEPDQEAQMPVSENGTEGGGEDATIPVETGDETGTTDETETPVVTTPTVTPTDVTTPVETLTPEPTNVTDGEAEVNGTQYATLAAAISAAEKNDVVVMLKDIPLSATVTVDTDKQLTLDLNGYTITGSGNFTILINNGVLTLKDSMGQGGISYDSNVPVAVGSNSTTTIESGTYTGREGAVITSRSVGATINIQGGTFKATDNAVIAGNGSDRTGDGNTINISGFIHGNRAGLRNRIVR